MRLTCLRRHPGKLRVTFLPPRGGRLLIGGVEIAITAPASARLRISNPLYRPFIGKSPSAAGALRLAVRVSSESFPKMPGSRAVFDTGDSWVLRRAGDDYGLSLASPGHKDPLWVAHFGRRSTRVGLHCRPAVRSALGRETIDLPLVYPLDQLLMMHFLARRRGILAHAAGVVIAGKAYLFAGVSGAGKSTFSLLLAAARAGKMLSDERVIVRLVKGRLVAFGTPWAGTANIASAVSAPLAGIFLLKHGKTNRLEPLDPVAASDRMLPMVSIPWYDPDTAAPIIAFVKRLVSRVPAHEFSFVRDGSAVDYFLKSINE